MSLIEEILSLENLNEAIKRVKANKGASGIDKMSVDMLEPYFNENMICKTYLAHIHSL